MAYPLSGHNRIKARAMPVFLPPVHGLLRWPPSVLSKGTALGGFANTASRHQRDPSNALSIHSAYKQQNKTTPNSWSESWLHLCVQLRKFFEVGAYAPFAFWGVSSIKFSFEKKRAKPTKIIEVQPKAELNQNWAWYPKQTSVMPFRQWGG